jgi:hypothetical protein
MKNRSTVNANEPGGVRSNGLYFQIPDKPKLRNYGKNPLAIRLVNDRVAANSREFGMRSLHNPCANRS